MFGDKIAALRERMKLTQEELADKIGITRASLSHYEKNRREPDYEILTKFAIFFGVTTDYLLGLSTHELSPDDKKNLREKFKYLSLDEQKAWISWFVNNIKDNQ